MDLADSEIFRHALASQGALIGQHNKLLMEILTYLQELQANVLLHQASPASSAQSLIRSVSVSAENSIPQTPAPLVHISRTLNPISSCYSGQVGKTTGIMPQEFKGLNEDLNDELAARDN